MPACRLRMLHNFCLSVPQAVVLYRNEYTMYGTDAKTSTKVISVGYELGHVVLCEVAPGPVKVYTDCIVYRYKRGVDFDGFSRGW